MDVLLGIRFLNDSRAFALQSLESYIILGSIPNSAGTMVLWLSFFFDYSILAVYL